MRKNHGFQVAAIKIDRPQGLVEIGVNHLPASNVFRVEEFYRGDFSLEQIARDVPSVRSILQARFKSEESPAQRVEIKAEAWFAAELLAQPKEH